MLKASTEALKQSVEKLRDSIKDLKKSIDELKNIVFDIVEQIEEKIIIDRYITNIQTPVIILDKIHQEWVERSSQVNRDSLIKHCEKTDGMKDVLINLHNDIVNQGENHYNQLLDGGVSEYFFIYEYLKF